MGAWGYGVFDNDDALDIRHRFERYIKEGCTVTEASERSISDFPDPMNDVCVVLAIAALQLEHGQLSPQIRERAIHFTTDKIGLDTWRDQGKRAHELELFRKKLQ